MGEKFSWIPGVLFAVIGLVQFIAVFAALDDVLGWPTIIAFMVAAPIAFIPVVGMIAGILGAVYGLGWSWGAALILFAAPWALYFVIAGIDRLPWHRISSRT